MIDPAVKSKILEDLEQLPTDLQKRAQELVHELARQSRPVGKTGTYLRNFFGSIDEQSATQMERAIRESRILRDVKIAERQLAEGRGVPHEEARSRLLSRFLSEDLENYPPSQSTTG